MKKYLNFAGMIGVLCVVFMLSACGGSGRTDAEYEGKYISVSGEAIGMTLTGEDISGFGLELKSGGKGTMTVNGESDTIKWTNDDKNITVKISGTDIVGAIGQDTITFDNMLNMGMKLTFAKEDSEAAKLENTLPESDKRMLGIWQSHTVTDVLGDPIEGFSGDELKMEFAADHTAKVTFKGKDLGSHKWSLVGDWGSLDGDELNINWDITDNGIDVNYSTDDDYFVFGCTKQS